MKKTLVSLAAAAALTTGAMAADKGIDIVTTGQAVVYYETHASGGTNAPSIFNKRASAANVGLQLNLGADLGNNFTFGSQLSYLGTAGLEKNLVRNTKQDVTQSLRTDTASQLMLSKIFVAKKIGNTTVKLGRQELPKSLSPLAFSEGWNVFKNTFDAVLVVNSDIPDTTVVGAYVSKGNGTGPVNDYVNMQNLGVQSALGTLFVNNGAYMLTAQNKSIPMTAITASYYHLAGVNGSSQGDYRDGTATSGSADALWLDVTVAGKDMPMGLKIAGQYGSIMTGFDAATNTAIAANQSKEDTTAYGVKIAMAPMDKLSVEFDYSSVDNGAASIQNVGTGVKTALYTQMVYNQNAISRNASTYVLKGSYNMGDSGKIALGYGMSKQNKLEAADTVKGKYNEFDLIYKVKAGGIQYFAALMYITAEDGAGIIGDGGTYTPDANGNSDMDDTKLRFWARYAF